MANEQEPLIIEGTLTAKGYFLALKMSNIGCDKVPCFVCPNNKKDAKGRSLPAGLPGGPGCPAERVEAIGSQEQVSQLLKLYSGKVPKSEVFSDALTTEIELFHKDPK